MYSNLFDTRSRARLLVLHTDRQRGTFTPSPTRRSSATFVLSYSPTFPFRRCRIFIPGNLSSLIPHKLSECVVSSPPYSTPTPSDPVIAFCPRVRGWIFFPEEFLFSLNGSYGAYRFTCVPFFFCVYAEISNGRPRFWFYLNVKTNADILTRWKKNECEFKIFLISDLRVLHGDP